MTAADKLVVNQPLGKGSYGVVSRGVYKGSACAVKHMIKHKSPRSNSGWLTFVMEIKAGRALSDHQNVVNLKAVELLKVCDQKNNKVHMPALIMDLADTSLDKILKDIHCKRATILSLSKQLLEAVRYMHLKNIAHLDLKPANILVKVPPTTQTDRRNENTEYQLLLADFGLATDLSPKTYQEVVTLWYRPPELVFDPDVAPEDAKKNACSYSPRMVDMWSVGCVIAEMFIGRPLFETPNWSKNKDIDLATDELFHVHKMWLENPKAIIHEAIKKNQTSSHSLLDDPACMELITSMLVVNPSNRCSAEDVLRRHSALFYTFEHLKRRVGF